ncbi:MAG: peptidoglycan-binding domain-containing protein [bacterium]|nr:peptidoglycan-binding domain-containing protein [bacterium]
MFLQRKSFYIFLVIFSVFFLRPILVLANTEGQVKSFFVEATYDKANKEQIETILENVSENSYFYLEKAFKEKLTTKELERVELILQDLSAEFDKVIYPKLTALYGQEWKNGIDRDPKITVVFHQLKSGAAGYFRQEDEYPKQQAQRSNEGEMVYLNADYLTSYYLKSFLAHEFTHLISFNQKERLKGIEEDVWLNEARAEFAPTLLDYDKDYSLSNLQQRVLQFLQSSSDSLTDWESQKKDYGSIAVFFQYLAEKYGTKIITNTMEANSAGFSSLSYSLEKWQVGKTIEEIFTDWLVAVYANDCSLGDKYCFKQEGLNNLKVVPSLIFLSPQQKKEFTATLSLKPWAGRWYRVLTTDGDLRVNLSAVSGVPFKLAYLLCDKANSCSVELKLPDLENKVEINIADFALKYNSLTLIPSVQPKTKTLFENQEEPFFELNLSTKIENTEEEKNLIASLEAQIAQLKAQIALITAQLQATLAKNNTCSLTSDLFFGKQGEQVKCLQTFLVSQGKDIYPTALVTGYFGPLTKAAVIRFQEKYRVDILTPFNLFAGNGFVGALTRAKINSLISQ